MWSVTCVYSTLNTDAFFVAGTTNLIKGDGNKSSVGTLVERKSRFVQLIKLDGATAADALEGDPRQYRGQQIPLNS